jgi:uncharacterized protein YkwD
MFCRPLEGCLLAGLIFGPASAFGQSVREEHTEAVQPPATRSAASAATPDLARVKQEILDLTNQFRRQEGRGDLKTEPHLSAAAQDFADFMARTDKYGHTADGKEPWERGKEHGYAYCLFLENIAYQYSSAGFKTDELARNFMESWEHSPPHRKNLLDPDIYDIGIGVACSSKTGRYYAVQDFGRPKSEEIVFKVTNQSGESIKYAVDGQVQTIEPRYTITHERCRPPEVSFQPANGKEPVGTKLYHPHAGAHYVIQRAQGGSYVVRLQ